jgi:hypothetical protein
MVSVKNLERNLREFKLLAAKVTKGANLALKAAKAANRRSSMSPKRRRSSMSPKRRRSSMSPKRRRRRPISPKRRVMNNVIAPLDEDEDEEKEISMNNLVKPLEEVPMNNLEEISMNNLVKPLEEVPMNVPLHKTDSCSYKNLI